jgi:hypothetical protein
MPWIAAAVLGGSVISGSMAQKGAQTQADAARQSAELQKQMFDIQNQQQAPYREAGYSALSDIGNMKPYLTHQFGTEDFQQGIDPGYAFRLQQGQRALQAQQNQAGGLIGGNALAAMQDYTQGQASQEYQNAFNRYQTQRGNIYNSLASIAGLGQTSLGQTGQLSGQTAQGVGNAISGAGQAIGAGQVAMGNALAGGVQTLGNQQYLSNLLGQRNPLAAPSPTSGSNFMNSYNAINTPVNNQSSGYF